MSDYQQRYESLMDELVKLAKEFENRATGRYYSLRLQEVMRNA